MEHIEILIDAGWDISLFRQKKRQDGNFVSLIQWRAKRSYGLKEYTNENKGFDTATEAMNNIWDTLTNLK